MSGRSIEAETISAGVLIVGGGMAGLTLAHALKLAGIVSAVIDAEDPGGQQAAEFDGRASAVAASSWRLLAAIGVAGRLLPHAEPIRGIRVLDGGSPVLLRFDPATVDGEPFGYMVENRHIRAALLEGLEDQAPIRHFAPARIRRLDRGPYRVEATLEDGRRIVAALVVAADGRASATREGAGIRTIARSYGQSGVVTAIEHEKDHQGVAFERFLPAGPFAVLPLTGRRSSLVWTEETARAEALLRLDRAAFDAELRARLGDFLGDLLGEARSVGPRWNYPLGVVLAERLIDLRLALLGDAAHGVHPVAGQGLNMALRDVAALAEVLCDARRLGLDLGAPSTLERYQRWRRFDNAVLTAVTDGLVRLFSNRDPVLKAGRDLGLAAVNRIDWLKRRFILEARGDAGSLPRLLKG